MLKSRHRLFRRRTTWERVRDNLYLLVTAAALIATAFAWTAISQSERRPLPRVATTDLDIAPPPAPGPSASIVEPAAPARSAVPTAPPPLPKATALSPEHARPSRVADASPAIARPTAPADARKIRRVRRLTQELRGRHAHPTRTRVLHHLHGKSPALMARAAKGHKRVLTHVSGRSDRDPFDCSVRNNKPPCFHVERPTTSGRR